MRLALGASRARNVEHAQLHAAAAITQFRSNLSGDPGDLFHRADQHPHTVAQQARVGRIMDVGLDHRGVHTQTPAFHDPLVQRDLHKPRVNLLDCLGSERCSPAAHCLGVRRLCGAHPGKVPVHQISSYLALQHFIAPVANMLEDQKPQHHFGRSGAAAPAAALGMTLRQGIVHSPHQLLVRQNLIGMRHPVFPQITDFLDDQSVAEAELGTAHLNHDEPSRAAPAEAARD